MHFATHTFQHPHEFSAPENMHMGGGVDDWVTGYPVWVLRPKSKLQHIGLVNNLTIIYTTNLFTNFAIRLRVFRCSCSSMPQSMRSVIAYVISIPATILATSRTGTCTAWHAASTTFYCRTDGSRTWYTTPTTRASTRMSASRAAPNTESEWDVVNKSAT